MNSKKNKEKISKQDNVTQPGEEKVKRDLHFPVGRMQRRQSLTFLGGRQQKDKGRQPICQKGISD